MIETLQEPRIWDDYPFPLADGSLAWVRVQRGALQEEDVDRFAEYLRSLVVERVS